MNKRTYCLLMALNVTFLNLFIYFLGLTNNLGIAIMLLLILLITNYFSVLKSINLYKPLDKLSYPTKGMRLSIYFSLFVLFTFYLGSFFFLYKTIVNFPDPLLALIKINIALGALIFLINVVLTAMIDFVSYGLKKVSFFAILIQSAVMNIIVFIISTIVFLIIGFGIGTSSF